MRRVVLELEERLLCTMRVTWESFDVSNGSTLNDRAHASWPPAFEVVYLLCISYFILHASLLSCTLRVVDRGAEVHIWKHMCYYECGPLPQYGYHIVTLPQPVYMQL